MATPPSTASPASAPAELDGGVAKKLEARIELMESTLLTELRALQQEMQFMRKVAAAPPDASSSQKLASTVRVAFEKYDNDHNGFIDLEELGQALGELTRPMAGAGTLSHVASYMRSHDRDGDGQLNLDEFESLVRELAASGSLLLNEEMQSQVSAMQRDADSHPWANALRVDSQVKSMVRDLRTHARRRRRQHADERDSVRDSTRKADHLAEYAGDVPSFRSGHIDDLLEPSERPTRWGRHARWCGGLRRGCGQWAWRLMACVCAPCAVLPVLSPTSGVKTAWSLVMAILICYCGVAVPMEIAFDRSLKLSMGDTGWEVWEAVNLVIDCSFLVDIAISFRTGYIVEGKMVKDGTQIATNYLRGGFVIDLLGSFPINFFLALTSDDGTDGGGTARLNRNLRLLRIVKLNRLLRLSKLSRALKSVEQVIRFNPSALRLCKLMLLMLACCHWMGCAWWLVSDLELSETATPTVPFNDWQPSAELLQSPTLGPQFAAAFVWGTGMVTATVPYDILPATEAEAYVTSICLSLGLLLNAFVIGSMASALSSIDSKKQVCAGRLETIGSYLQLHHVKSELRAKILEYYEYLYTSSQSVEMSDLPPALATRLALTIHRKVVTRSPFFTALSDVALLGVLKALTPTVHVPQDVLAAEGSLLHAVFFIKKGQVLLSHGGVAHRTPAACDVLRRGCPRASRTSVPPPGGSGKKPLGARARTECLSRTMSGRTLKGTERIAGANDAIGLDAIEAKIEQESNSSVASSSLTDGSGRFRSLSNVLVLQTAEAMTYCDLVSLTVADLSDILSRDSKWSTVGRGETRADARASRWRSPTAMLTRMARVSTRRSPNEEAPAVAPMAAAEQSGVGEYPVQHL